eukprot:GHVU01153810.1.p1 GENE.GHVU01153810.1~~GHVU01153810.1.p1  ORF type:complete len:564 (+),score=68.42 GHVU01153810.1:232-1692(+)
MNTAIKNTDVGQNLIEGLRRIASGVWPSDGNGDAGDKDAGDDNIDSLDDGQVVKFVRSEMDRQPRIVDQVADLIGKTSIRHIKDMFKEPTKFFLGKELVGNNQEVGIERYQTTLLNDLKQRSDDAILLHRILNDEEFARTEDELRLREKIINIGLRHVKDIYRNVQSVDQLKSELSNDFASKGFPLLQKKILEVVKSDDAYFRKPANLLKFLNDLREVIEGKAPQEDNNIANLVQLAVDEKCGVKYMDNEVENTRSKISDLYRFCEDPLRALINSDIPDYDHEIKAFFTPPLQSGFKDYMERVHKNFIEFYDVQSEEALTCDKIVSLHDNHSTSELTKPIRTMVHMMHFDRHVNPAIFMKEAIQALVSVFRSIVNFPGVSTADAALTTKFEEMRTEYRTELRKIVEDLSIRFHDKNDTISEISDRSQGYASAVQSEIEEPLKSKAKLVEDAINKGEDSATILQQLSLQDNLGGRFCLSKCLEIIRV